MPKQISEKELDVVLRAAARFPQGCSIEDIAAALEEKLPRRTLQRRLALLVERKRLAVEGRARGSRYRPAARVVEARGEARGRSRAEGHGEAHIPVSPEAEIIRKSVREPIQNRRPVGYNRAFLDAYRNETFYLSAETRQRLLELGRSPDGVRPAGTYARQIYSRLLIDLSWNSSRLEGNTYSLLETECLLELGEAAEGKDAREAQMILNHKAAIELLVEQASEVGFNRYTILNLHALLVGDFKGIEDKLKRSAGLGAGSLTGVRAKAVFVALEK